MVPSHSRPLSEEQRGVLKRLASPSRERANDFLSTLCVFMLVFGVEVGSIRLVSGPPEGAVIGIAAGVAGAVALGVLVRMRRTVTGRALRAGRTAFAADLDGGQLVTETFEVADAICIEEHEDEGSSYYLKLADGTVLFLSGQYLYEPEDAGSFPSTRVAVTRAPQSRIVFDVECLGQPLPASAKRAPFSREEHRAGRVPPDGALLRVDFESLRAKG